MDVLHHVDFFEVDGDDLRSSGSGECESGGNRVHHVDFLRSFKEGESGCALLLLAISKDDIPR